MSHPDFAAEERRLSGTIDTMISRAERLTFRPDNGDLEDERTPGVHNIGADSHTSLVIRMDNEETAELIDEHLDAPYFGRLDVQAAGKTQSLYIGMVPFYDPKGHHSVTDWRAPIAGLLNSAGTTLGKATVTLKRKIDIKRRRLLSVTDLYGETVSDPEQAREDVLLTRLAEKSEGRMSHVVPTIQPEQDVLIRAPMPGTLLVQGPAGSGKTSVAFHRVSVLSFGDQAVSADQTLILVPNDVMLNYARQMTEELDIPTVRLSTPQRLLARLANLGEQVTVTDTTLDLLLGRASKLTKRNAWLRAKALGEETLFDVMRCHALNIIESSLTARPGPFTAEQIHAAMHAARTGHALDVRQAVATHLAGQGERSGMNETDARSEADKAVKRAPLGAPVVLLRSLLTPDALARASEQAGGTFTAPKQKAALLDAPKHLTRMVGAHADHITLPLTVVATLLLGQLPTGLPLTRHLVIDEAHDISPLTYRVLREALRPEGVTALGDINQSIHGYRGLSSWTQAAEALGTPGAGTSFLRRSYRSTAQITKVAKQVAATYTRDPDSIGEAVGRDGLLPTWHQGPAQDATIRAVRTSLDNGQRSVAVLLRSNPAQCETLAAALGDAGIQAQAITRSTHRYAGGVVVTTVDRAKGMEFDACVVADAHTEAYPSADEYERRLLYVAVTRGMHELHLVHGEYPQHDLLT